MPATLVLVLGFALMLGLMVSGLPVFVAFLLITAGGAFAAFGPASFGLFTNSLVATLSSESLVAIPLFLLMGELLARSGAMDELYEALDILIAHTRIRLYLLAISLSTALGTMSGSAMADAALLGRTVYPGMIGRGYDPRLSCGLLLSGATLAPIIPPSVLAVILATLAQISIAELLIAGLVPGLLLAGLFLAYVWIRVRLDPSKAPLEDASAPAGGRRSRAVAAARLLPFCGVIFMVIGLILLGIASPTEAAATGALAAAAVAAWLGNLGVRLIAAALFSTARTTAVIMAILMSANLFAQLLAYTGAPGEVVGTVIALEVDPWLILVALLLVAFVACMFLGVTEFMLISVPLYAPVVSAVGFEPVWFWLLFLITTTAGGMTPPFGMTMFVFQAAVPQMPMAEVYRATWPFVAVIALGIILLALFPEVVLFLPGLM